MKNGDRVRLVMASEFDRLNGLEEELEGVVVGDLDEDCLRIKFDTWNEGHGVGGNEWFVPKDYLQVVP